MTYGSEGPAISAISLRRGPCFGACPVYQVTFGMDGTATWVGERFVERVGEYRGEVDVNELSRLLSFVERAGFYRWDSEYTTPTTDAPDYVLTVEGAQGSKSVRQNASEEPPDFWVIAALVDALAEKTEWQQTGTAAEGGAGAAERQLEEFRRRPVPASHRLLDFDSASIVTLESYQPQYVLTVTGTKPYLNMEVDLVPLMYIRQPEYWGIEVVGCLNGPGLPVMTPFTVSLRLAGITGTRGVEVIGASRTEQLDVPPEPQLDTCFGWAAYHDHMPPGPMVLRVTGTCEFRTAGYEVALSRHEPQGINPSDLLLDLTIREPSGPVPEVITQVEARYEEVTDFEYETVTILPIGTTIPVQDVH